MKLSIIIPVLNSHKALRRQLLHFERIGLPDDTELIIVDDGSDPPLGNTSSLPVRMFQTGDTREWTWALARNHGARQASGDYLLMFDLDHILTRECMDFVVERADSLLAIGRPRIHFLRRFGVLDEDGVLITDRDVLESYGLKDARTRIESHHNSFAMHADLFWRLGGYREDLIGQPYPQGEDSGFYNAWREYAEANEASSCEGPEMYLFPTGRFCGDVDHDAYGLFHTLSRKSDKNFWWKYQRRQECQQQASPRT